VVYTHLTLLTCTLRAQPSLALAHSNYLAEFVVRDDFFTPNADNADLLEKDGASYGVCTSLNATECQLKTTVAFMAAFSAAEMCAQPCSEVTYKTGVTFSHWPADQFGLRGSVASKLAKQRAATNKPLPPSLRDYSAESCADRPVWMGSRGLQPPFEICGSRTSSRRRRRREDGDNDDSADESGDDYEDFAYGGCVN
jgi:hypothetical protein